MFRNRDADKLLTLQEMRNKAHDLCLADQTEARKLMTAWVRQDRRFDGNDAADLVDQYYAYRSGAPRPRFDNSRDSGFLTSTGRRL